MDNNRYWPDVAPVAPNQTQPLFINSADVAKIRALELEILDLKKQLEDAHEYDIKTGQPECHDPLKSKLLINMLDECKKNWE